MTSSNERDPNQTGQNGPKSDEPLTPEALAMFSKARRSFGISIGILLLGFMAIGIALVYRVMRDAPLPAVSESVMLEPGAQVVSAVVSDGVINVTYTAGGWTVLALFDQATGAFVQRVVLQEALSAAMPEMPEIYQQAEEAPAD